jgi:hypothetical protein
MSPPAETNPETVYLAGLVTRSDRQGRTIVAELWLVQCGPPEGKNGLTTQPFPGLTVDRQAGSCTTNEPQILRDAARASEALAGRNDLLRIRWLRDGEH